MSRPHLIREVPAGGGKQARFEKLLVDIGKMADAFPRATADPAAVFGTWDDWHWSKEATGEVVWDSVYEGKVARSKLSRSLSLISELRSRTGRLEPASPFKGAQGSSAMKAALKAPYGL